MTGKTIHRTSALFAREEVQMANEEKT
jgi:hypothetical protein